MVSEHRVDTLWDSLHKPLTDNAYFALPKNVHKEMAIMFSSGTISGTLVAQDKLIYYQWQPHSW